jgi:hypothetical protein
MLFMLSFQHNVEGCIIHDRLIIITNVCLIISCSISVVVYIIHFLFIYLFI